MKFFSRKKASESSPKEKESKQQTPSTAVASSTTSSSSNAELSSFQYTPYDELYGQHIPKETPELISSKLQDLQKELDIIPDNDKEDWLTALQKCPNLCDDKFKLMFLRCEIFNCDLAAKRIAKYWKKRVELFGADLAFQPLVLGPNGPFQNDDYAMKEIAFIRCLNTNDLAGRPILFGDPSRLPVDQTTYENVSVARSLWYYVHAVLEDETAQRKGVIMMIFPKNIKLGALNRKLMQLNAESIKGCLPLRISAIHMCHPPRIFDLIFPILKAVMGPHLRKKVKLNSGSEEKVLERLNSEFFISKEKLPTELGGEIELDHKKWLEERMKAGF